MEKFKKLSKEEMKKVLGGGDEVSVAPGGGECQNNCPCPAGQTCMLMGCGGDTLYAMCG